MKKIFFVAGLTGICTAACSQQEDFFHAQKHLKKKTLLFKKTAVEPAVRNFALVPEKNLTVSKLLRSYTLPNGDKIFFLPVDNMPCVSPDMNRYRVMPNADKRFRLFYLRQHSAGQIPNPAIPLPPAGRP